MISELPESICNLTQLQYLWLFNNDLINIPECICEHKASMKVISNKNIKPTESEIKENPRSRSAKLRLAEKL